METLKCYFNPLALRDLNIIHAGKEGRTNLSENGGAPRKTAGMRRENFVAAEIWNMEFESEKSSTPMLSDRNTVQATHASPCLILNLLIARYKKQK